MRRQLVVLLLCSIGLAGCTRSLQGHWSGTSDYFNAPFTLDITQASDGRLSGTYQDQNDKGSVDGTKRVVGTLRRTGGQHGFAMTKP